MPANCIALIPHTWIELNCIGLIGSEGSVRMIDIAKCFVNTEISKLVSTEGAGFSQGKIRVL